MLTQTSFDTRRAIWLFCAYGTSQVDGKPHEQPASVPAEAGDGHVLNGLGPLYDELRKLAEQQLRHQRPDHTLPATALVHEAYLRLAQCEPTDHVERADLLRLAARAMRSVLVDHARRRNAIKRKAAGDRVSLDTVTEMYERSAIDLIALDEALTELVDLEPRWAAIIELRVFGGCTEEEVGELLQLSPRTVERQWRAAKAWLRHRIDGDSDQ
jgi:RNA polymerase sigma factor (TIGR02999 family)